MRLLASLTIPLWSFFFVLTVPWAHADDLVLTGTEPIVKEIAPDTRVASIVFDANLQAATTLRGGPIVLLDDAVIRYQKNAAVANQTIECALELRGAATLTNDNAWTHEAHMIRLLGPIHGSGTLTIRGQGDGGIEIRSDNRSSFTGAIQILGGRLIVRSAGSLGNAERTTTLRGGDCFLGGGVTLEEPFTIAGDASISTGGASTLRGDVTLRTGATLTFDTGGGNVTRMLGRLSGEGDVLWIGGGSTPQTQSAASLLGGTQPTTLSGQFTLKRGTIALAKPDGVDAIAGTLVIGGGSNQATVRLDASHQIADDAALRLVGPHPARLGTQGHDETVGPLSIATAATIDLGGDGELVFADSSEHAWAEASLIIEGGSGRPGSGASLRFEGTPGLTEDQVARIGFRDPTGLEPGLYRAKRLPSGELTPTALVVEQATNPFSISDGARAARARLYEVAGRSRLTSPETALREGDVLTFFGDSITWQHRYLGKIEAALADGTGTKARTIRLVNRGINGGGVRDLRNGSTGNARAGGIGGAAGNSPQAAFADILREDRPRVVVVYIGINDITWRGTTPEQFEEVLRELVRQIRSADALPVLATPALAQERPDGSNQHDAKIDAYSDLTRAVASDMQAALVDLRAACIAYLQNHNAALQLDGSLIFEERGFLTYDGIHPNDRGNELLADLIADGIARALEKSR